MSAPPPPRRAPPAAPTRPPPPTPGSSSSGGPLSPSSTRSSSGPLQLPGRAPPPPPSRAPPITPTAAAKAAAAASSQSSFSTMSAPRSSSLSSARVCQQCQLPVGPNECISAAGRFFHPSHFRCALCSTVLSATNYRCTGDLFVCGPCGDSKCQPCLVCSLLLVRVASTQAVVDLGEGAMCHKSCFTCAHCNVSLSGKPLAVERKSGQLYCGDHASLHMPSGYSCAGCGEDIFGRVLLALDEHWHPEHFVCAHCLQPLEQQPFLVHDSNVYCARDYQELHAPKCSACLLPLTDTSVSLPDAPGVRLHPACVVCLECKTDLSSGAFYTDPSDPARIFCREHHDALFVQRCDVCSAGITGEEPLRVLGKRVHHACFRCSARGCTRPLASCAYTLSPAGLFLCDQHQDTTVSTPAEASKPAIVPAAQTQPSSVRPAPASPAAASTPGRSKVAALAAGLSSSIVPAAPPGAAKATASSASSPRAATAASPAASATPTRAVPSLAATPAATTSGSAPAVAAATAAVPAAPALSPSAAAAASPSSRAQAQPTAANSRAAAVAVSPRSAALPAASAPIRAVPAPASTATVATSPAASAEAERLRREREEEEAELAEAAAALRLNEQKQLAARQAEQAAAAAAATAASKAAAERQQTAPTASSTAAAPAASVPATSPSVSAKSNASPSAAATPAAAASAPLSTAAASASTSPSASTRTSGAPTPKRMPPALATMPLLTKVPDSAAAAPAASAVTAAPAPAAKPVETKIQMVNGEIPPSSLGALISKGIAVTLEDANVSSSATGSGSGDYMRKELHALQYGGVSFELMTYAPRAFADVRAHFGISNEHFVKSLVTEGVHGGAVGDGKSGMLFYFSHDGKYVLKTVKKDELHFFRTILSKYVRHMTVEQRHSLLPRFFSLLKIKYVTRGDTGGSSGGDTRIYRLVVMSNLFDVPKSINIVHRFDLKGSTRNRHIPPDKATPGRVLLDLNWNEQGLKLRLGPTQKQLFLKQLKADCAFLQAVDVMDHSLLLGIHEDEPSDASSSADGAALDATPVTSAALSGPLRPCKVHPESGGLATGWQCSRGGVRAFESVGNKGEIAPRREVYYMGIIDILQKFNTTKRLESAYKVIRFNKNAVSAIESKGYNERFIKYMDQISL